MIIAEQENKTQHDAAALGAVEDQDEPMNEQLLNTAGYTTGAKVDNVYTQIMESKQFGKYIQLLRLVDQGVAGYVCMFTETIRFFGVDGTTPIMPYHYAAQLRSTSTKNMKRTRRLAQEIVTLSNSLPLSLSSTVFLRTAEERLDAMKILITGPGEFIYESPQHIA